MLVCVMLLWSVLDAAQSIKSFVRCSLASLPLPSCSSLLPPPLPTILPRLPSFFLPFLPFLPLSFYFFSDGPTVSLLLGVFSRHQP